MIVFIGRKVRVYKLSRINNKLITVDTAVLEIINITKKYTNTHPIAFVVILIPDIEVICVFSKMDGKKGI